MRFALLTLLLLTLPALAAAEAPLHALLALIEQNNPELLEQRRLLDATVAVAAPSGGLTPAWSRERSYGRWMTRLPR